VGGAGETLSDSRKLAIHVVWSDAGVEPIGAQSICPGGGSWKRYQAVGYEYGRHGYPNHRFMITPGRPGSRLSGLLALWSRVSLWTLDLFGQIARCAGSVLSILVV